MRSALIALVLCAACRPEPGLPDYPEPDAISFGGDEDGLPEGPDPYEDGEHRLSLGAFYEGGASEVVPIDDVGTHYYIYSDTYGEEVDLQDRVEGRVSTVLTMGSVGWFGGGIHWDGGGDLSDWTTFFVSLRSRDVEDFELRMIGGAEGGVWVGDHGYLADGAWHHVAIPLEDFPGVDLRAVTVPFMIIGEGVSSGQTLKIDNVYLTRD